MWIAFFHQPRKCIWQPQFAGDVDVTTNLPKRMLYIDRNCKIHQIKITTCMSSLSSTQNLPKLVYFDSMLHLSRLRTFNAPEVQAPQQRIFWMLTPGSTGHKVSTFGSIHVCWFKLSSQVHLIVNWKIKLVGFPTNHFEFNMLGKKCCLTNIYWNAIKSKTSVSSMDALIHRRCSNHATYSASVAVASLSNMILQVPTRYEAILLM